MTPAVAIEKYLLLRNKVKEVEARHKAELAPYLDLKTKLEAFLLEHLNQAGLDSEKCGAGTAFKSTVTSVTVKDWPRTLAFIRDTGAWELLESRVAKGPALELIGDTENAIPGVDISQVSVLRVRSS